jgi:predicted GNAT family acetyltransferase
VILDHTEVKKEHEGAGHGGSLVRHALAAAREEGKTVIPTCSFAKGYIERHPELAEFLAVRPDQAG